MPWQDNRDAYYHNVGRNVVPPRNPNPSRGPVRRPAGGRSGGSGGSGRGGGRSNNRYYATRRGLVRRGRLLRKRSRRTRKSRKSKMRPVDHSKNGVSLVYEVSGITGGTDDDSEAIYVGHANMPAGNMLNIAVRAVIKAVYMRMGITIRTYNEISSVPGVMTFLYYTTPIATVSTGINFTVTGTSTYNDVAAAFFSGIQAAIHANPGFRPYAFVFVPSSGIRRTFYTDSVSLNFTSLSRLKLQNRTPNEGGTDSVDTNDVNFLVGSIYAGSGTGTYIKSSVEGTPHQPLIGTDGSGRILMTRSDNMAASSSFLRHPPENTKLFTRVKSHSTISKFAPGATKYSSLYTHRKLSFAQMLDMYLKDVAANAYTLSTMGQFRFFGLQKFIDDDAAVKVKIAYEVELQLGCTCSMRTNVHTQPVYIETTE